MINYGTVTILDLLAIVIYFLILIFFSNNYFKKKIALNYSYLNIIFTKAFATKLIFGILYNLIFLYYYGYGDTLSYYREASTLHNFIFDNPTELIKVFSLNGSNYYDYLTTKNVNLPAVYDYYNNAQVKVIQFGCIASIFTFNSIFAMSMLFSTIAFIGNWHFYKLFIKIFPTIHKKPLFNILFFLPSILFWANGISKDSLIYGFLGMLIYYLHKIIIERKISILIIISCIILSNWIFNIKPYILILTIPCFIIYIIVYYINLIPINFLKFVLIFISILFILGSLFLLKNTITSGLESVFIDNFIEQSASARTNLINDSGEEGSSFDIGKIEPTIQGLLLAIPRCINASLYRPYIWESKKIITLFSALESLLMLIATIYISFRVNIFYFFRSILSSPFLLFVLLNIFLLGILVGLTTSNFGTLVRYKMPLLPYFIVLHYSIYCNWQIKMKNSNRIL